MVRWLVCKVDALDAGRQLLQEALAQMAGWGVTTVGADCALPALGCYGIPDTLRHIRGLIAQAGFGDPTRTEVVLVARCDELVRHARDGLLTARTLGLLGARFTLRRDDHKLGYIEVCDQTSAMARSAVAARWADIGNLVIRDGGNRIATESMLLSTAADWLLLGGITRLVHYWAKDVDTPWDLAELQQLGFRRLVTNERGFQRPA